MYSGSIAKSARASLGIVDLIINLESDDKKNSAPDLPAPTIVRSVGHRLLPSAPAAACGFASVALYLRAEIPKAALTLAKLSGANSTKVGHFIATAPVPRSSTLAGSANLRGVSSS